MLQQSTADGPLAEYSLRRAAAAAVAVAVAAAVCVQSGVAWRLKNVSRTLVKGSL
jgi:hypothetical protein